MIGNSNKTTFYFNCCFCSASSLHVLDFSLHFFFYKLFKIRGCCDFTTITLVLVLSLKLKLTNFAVSLSVLEFHLPMPVYQCYEILGDFINGNINVRKMYLNPHPIQQILFAMPFPLLKI